MPSAQRLRAQSARLTNAEALKKIGERMREARELCNYSQQEAAKRLGYRNSSKLAKIEHATDIQSVPLSVIVKAARIYDVSADYLLGLSDDFESEERLNVERHVTDWLVRTWEDARMRDIQAMRVLHAKIAAVDQATGAMVGSTLEVREALEKFVERNPEFEDMPAGSSLVSRVMRAQESAQHARERLRRIQFECNAAFGKQLEFEGLTGA
jgi:transcriptional regulator with XRE-family HTH domain